MSAYVKSIDPAHLVMVSSWGYFGHSTPELQAQNPFDLTWRGIGNNAGVWKSHSYSCIWHLLRCARGELHLLAILCNDRLTLMILLAPVWLYRGD